MVGILQLARSGVMVMSEQYLITLDEWKPKRFSLPITNTTLVKYGKLGYIVPRPQKIRGRWLIDRRAVFVGPGEAGIAPEIHTGDDDALKEILTHVTEATKKQY
ncbi:excisionase [Escherichia coli STEC_EH250]|nr:excisionase [Escherichia coli STEC_EH250]EHW37477.1 putative excisionase [Escherichia coli DEC9A]EHW40243.1 putative excisionase [Escherichia coli DEC9A]